MIAHNFKMLVIDAINEKRIQKKDLTIGTENNKCRFGNVDFFIIGQRGVSYTQPTNQWDLDAVSDAIVRTFTGVNNHEIEIC